MGILCAEGMRGWEVTRPRVSQQKHCARHKGLFGRRQNVLHFSKASRTEETLEGKKKEFKIVCLLPGLSSA